MNISAMTALNALASHMFETPWSKFVQIMKELINVNIRDEN